LQPNPYDPRDRQDLTKRERIVLEFTSRILHGDELHRIEEYVAPDYRQHTPGIGQGAEGLRNFASAIASKRPNRKVWRPIHLFACGDFVILHKLLTAVVIADFFRFNDDDKLIEHWDVVQPLPEPDYDPMRLSREDFTRFYKLYDMDRRDDPI
jgi:predicted SnoaL-like aldol condensation-catalyzing enzyme